MATRSYKFIIVLLALFLVKNSFGQQQPDSLRAVTAIKTPSAGNFSLVNERALVLRGTTTSIPADNYCQTLAFFCRQEVKIEKAIKVPLRFRVGSLDQCNKLEGK